VSTDDEPSAARAEEPRTAPIPLVAPADPAPALDPPTTPLRIVAPAPTETNGPRDATTANSVNSADSDDESDDAPTTPEPHRAPVTETVSGLTGGLLGH